MEQHGPPARGGRRAPAAPPAAPWCRSAGTPPPGRPRIPATSASSSATTPPSPYRSTAVSGRDRGQQVGGPLRPVPARARGRRRRAGRRDRPCGQSRPARRRMAGRAGRLGACAHWSSTPSAVRSTVREVAAPEPPPGGVVVRVAASGICRSDWHGWQGHDPDVVLPHVPGHELAGTVAAVGAGVRALVGRRPGDRAVRLRLRAPARSALAGEHQVCERPDPARLHRTGARSPSWWRWTPPTSTWSPLPDELDLADRRGARAAASRPPSGPSSHVGRVRAGEWLAVHGCGGVGLSAVHDRGRGRARG